MVVARRSGTLCRRRHTYPLFRPELQCLETEGTPVTEEDFHWFKTMIFWTILFLIFIVFESQP